MVTSVEEQAVRWTSGNVASVASHSVKTASLEARSAFFSVVIAKAIVAQTHVSTGTSAKSARKNLAVVAMAFYCVVAAKVTVYVEIVVRIRTFRNAKMTASFATVAGRLEDVTAATTTFVAIVRVIPSCHACGKKYCSKDDCKQQLEHCGVCPFRNYAGTVMIVLSIVIDAMKAFASHMIVSWTVRHVTCAIVELGRPCRTGASFVPGRVSRIAQIFYRS